MCTFFYFYSVVHHFFKNAANIKEIFLLHDKSGIYKNDKSFSQSDFDKINFFRWSFGIVIWEIFSLGQTPYPGQGVDRNFIRWLKNEENRLMCPDNAPEKM